MYAAATFVVFSLALLLSGCFTVPKPVPAALGYTMLKVEKPIFDEPATVLPVAFVLDPHIQDAFEAKSSAGIKSLHVSEFRRTLLSGAREAFPMAQVVDAVPPEGLGIALVEVRPSVFPVGVLRSGYGRTQYTDYETRCEVTYGVSFFRDGTRHNVVGKVTSRDTAHLAEKVGAMCANGLEMMYADLRGRFAEFVRGK